LRHFKLKDLGGRQEVEKQIRRLQEAEANGVSMTPRYFIFDRDDAPSNLKDSGSVKVLQWERRCFENYLIDIDAMSELLRDPDITKNPIKGSGDVAILLKEMAMKHLNDEVVRKVYATYNIRSFSHKSSDTIGCDFKESAVVLFEKIENVRADVCTLNSSIWTEEFENKCASMYKDMFPIWDASWRDLCDGKRLFREIQRNVTLNMSLLSFKKRILLQMRANTSDSWRTVESLLKGLVGADLNKEVGDKAV
jgi:hypothetical protein